MNFVMPLLVGLLFSAAIFMMLRPQLMRVCLGIILLTNAANLFIFSSGRLSKEGPPIIDSGLTFMDREYGNPVSQALILTAIVIGFSLLSFVIALVYRAVTDFKTQDCSVISQSRIGKEGSEE